MLFVLSSCGYDEETAEPLKTSVKPNITLGFKGKTTIVSTTQSTVAKSSVQTVKETAERKSNRNATLKVEGNYAVKQTIAKKADYLDGYNGMRDVTARQILLDMGVGYNIANSLDYVSKDGKKLAIDTETYSGNPKITKQFILRLQMNGFGAIRLPVAFGPHIVNDDTFEIDSAWLNRVEDVVKMIISSNMYCVLTPQNEEKWLNTSDDISTVNAKLVSIWKQICKRFKNYNDKLIFQGFSEVKSKGNSPSSEDYENINLLNNSFVKTVRSSGGNNEVRHLVITTYGSYTDVEDMEKLKVPNDSIEDRIIVDVHFKYPAAFVGSEAEYNETTEWGTDSEKNTLEVQLYLIYYKLTVQLGCPVIIGQYYAANKENDEFRAKYAQYLARTAYKYTMICFWFDEGLEVNKLFDRRTGTATHPDIVKSMLDAIR